MLAAPGPDGPTLTVKDAVERAKMLQRKHRFTFNMSIVANQMQLKVKPDRRAKVLTDDQAPVNWLRRQEKKNSR
jgi:hypothetical protein